MPEPLHLAELPQGAPLLQALEAEAAAGGRVVAVFTARWAPPCRALRRALEDPEVAASLAGVRLLFVDVDRFGEELAALGFGPRGVPELHAWRPATGPVKPVLTGDDWGQDTTENIAAALARWLPRLP